MSKPIVLMLVPLFAGVFILGGVSVGAAALIIWVIFYFGFDLLGRALLGDAARHKANLYSTMTPEERRLWRELSLDEQERYRKERP